METNSNLELAAKRSLNKYFGKQEHLKPLTIQPDRGVFLAEVSQMVFKVYLNGNTLRREFEMTQRAKAVGVPIAEIIGLDSDEYTVLTMKQVVGTSLNTQSKNAIIETGKYLERFHTIGSNPPFSGGQNKWEEFILWWSSKEIESVSQLAIFSENEITDMKNRFKKLHPVLQDRPIVLLHGDLQAEHVIVDQQQDKLLAILDFADTQPGDPLLDIAVLTLSNYGLTNNLLIGYRNIENNYETQNLISHYRLLRHIAEIPWLLERGFKDRAERNISSIRRILHS